MIHIGRTTEPSIEELARLAAAFRSMPQSKLFGVLPDGRTRAQGGHQLAMLLAATGQGIEQRAATGTPNWRQLPFDGPFVVGDQIAVTGHDLLAGLRALGDPREPVWSPQGRRVAAADSVAAALEAAAALRALL